MKEKTERGGHGAGEETFESLLSRLEGIVHELEAGGIGLEESMKRFEEGVSILRRLREKLSAAEARVHVLTKEGALEGANIDWDRPPG